MVGNPAGSTRTAAVEFFRFSSGGAVWRSMGDRGATAAGEPRKAVAGSPVALGAGIARRFWCRRLAWTDRNGPRLGRPALGHPDGQDAVLGVRLGGIKVDVTGDHDLSEERAEPPLPDLELCFRQLADFLHASEDQQVAVDGEARSSSDPRPESRPRRSCLPGSRRRR